MPSTRKTSSGSGSGRGVSSDGLPYREPGPEADIRLFVAKPSFTISLGRRDLRRLFAGLRRVDDEFERVRILMLLHQLEVYEPFRISCGSAGREPISGRFEQRGCEFIFAVRSQAFHCLDKLTFGYAEVVDKKFRLVCAGEMFEAL